MLQILNHLQKRVGRLDRPVSEEKGERVLGSENESPYEFQ